jgi:hypothetical protein
MADVAARSCPFASAALRATWQRVRCSAASAVGRGVFVPLTLRPILDEQPLGIDLAPYVARVRSLRGLVQCAQLQTSSHSEVLFARVLSRGSTATTRHSHVRRLRGPVYRHHEATAGPSQTVLFTGVRGPPWTHAPPPVAALRDMRQDVHRMAKRREGP